MERLEVTIRAPEPDDAAALAAMHAGPVAVWGTMQLPYPAIALWRARLEDPQPGHRGLAACTADGDMVGYLHLMVQQQPRRAHVARFGMTVRDDVQGRGVGTQLVRAMVDLADDWLQVTRIELDVYPDNEPAIALYRRHGFEPEGLGRKAVFRDGEYVDILRMGRLHPRLANLDG